LSAKIKSKKATVKSAGSATGNTKPAAALIKIGTPASLTAKQFIQQLMAYRSPTELKKFERYFMFSADKPLKDDEFIGVRMGQVFELAKAFIDMPVAEIEKLLESRIHEARAAAVSIIDKRSRSKKITANGLKELFDLYMRRHDRINNWDLVDLGCLYMVGSYLIDKPRDILYKLAKSKNTWERRTAILGTAYLIRKGEVADTFKIAEMLLKDKEDLVHKGMGWMLRFAGDGKNRPLLLKFLDKHAAVMPRVALRYAIEKLDAKQRKYYLELAKG
jgi:3-methyladenine DNA glycosylase AlkD